MAFPSLDIYAGCGPGTLDELNASTGAVSASDNYAHTGTFSFRCNATGASAYFSVGAGYNKVFSFYVRWETFPGSTQQFFGHVTLYAIKISSTGTLYLYDNNVQRDTGSTISTGQWYHISGYVDSSDDAYVYLDGNLDLNYSGAGTSFGSNFGIMTTETYDVYFDDIALDWDVGTADPGDYVIYEATPSGEGYHQDVAAGTAWQDPSQNALTYDHTDTRPFGTSDYGWCEADGNQYRYSVLLPNCSTLGMGASDTIINLKYQLYYMTDGGGGTNEYYLLERDQGTTYELSIDDPKVATYYHDYASTPPGGGGSWTQAIFDGTEIGVYTDDANKDMWCYGLVVSVLVEVAAAISRSVSDSLTLGESAKGLIPVLYRSVSDSLSLGETVERDLTMAQSVSDSLTLAETIDRDMTTAALERSVSDSLSLAETVERNLVCYQTVVDSLSLAEVVHRVLIRVLEQLDSNTYASGENQPYAIEYHDGHLFVGLNTSPAKLLKVDICDLSDYEVLTFPSDGSHDVILQVRYSSGKDKVYVLFSESSAVIIDEVDPDDMTRTARINDSTYSAVSGSFDHDDSYIYVASPNDNVVVKYSMTTWSEDDNVAININCRSIEYDGSVYLFVGHAGSPGRITRVTASDLSTSTQLFDSGDDGTAADLCIASDYAWHGLQSYNGRLLKIYGGDLTITKVDTYLTGYDCRGTWYSGNHVWAAMTGSGTDYLVRVDPSTNEVEVYRHPGSDPREIATHSGLIFVGDYQSPADIYKLSEPERENGDVSTALTLAEDVEPNQVLNQSVSDSLALAEAVTRNLVSNQSVAETLAAAEVVQRNLVSNQAASDSLTLAETVDRSLVSNQSVSDSMTLAETVQRSLVLTQTVSDSLALAEVVDRNLVSNQSVSDTLTLAETVDRDLSMAQSVAEAMTLDEDVQPLIPVLYQSVSDSLALAETIQRNLSEALNRSVSDSLTLNETVDRLIPVLYRSVSDAMTLAEVVTRDLTMAQSVSDSLSLAEVVERTLVSNASVSDSLSLAESVDRTLISNQSVSDSLTLAEVVQRDLTVSRSVADSLSLAEVVQRDLTMAQSVADSLTLAEVVQRDLSISQSVSDTLTLAETIDRNLVSNQSVSDSLALNEDLERLIPILYRSVSDSLTLDESVDRDLISEGILSRSVSDTLSLGESVEPNTLFYQTVSDTLTLGESVSRSLSMAQSVSTTLTLAETVDPTLLSFVDVSDSLSLGESVDPLIPVLYRTVIETLTLAETADGLLPILYCNVSDTLSLGEAIERQIPLLYRAISDALTLVDVANGTTEVIISGSAVTTLSLSDTASGYIAVYGLNILEALTITDTLPTIPDLILKNWLNIDPSTSNWENVADDSHSPVYDWVNI